MLDHLGSPKLVVDMVDNSVDEEINYDEFGNVTLDTNPGLQPFGFAGRLYDRDTKLVHFGQREYDPSIGRWLQRDPIGFRGGDTNLYGYVLNDPVNFIDPSGEVRLGTLFGGVLLGGSVLLTGDAPDPINASFGGVCKIPVTNPDNLPPGVSVQPGNDVAPLPPFVGPPAPTRPVNARPPRRGTA